MLRWITRGIVAKQIKACEDEYEKSGWSSKAPNQLLSRALHSLRWTQTDLAERLGCDVSLVGDWLYARVETPKDVIAWVKRLKKLADNAPLSQRAVDQRVVEMMERAIRKAQQDFAGTTFESFDIPPPDYIRMKAEEKFKRLLTEANMDVFTFYPGSVKGRAAFDFACQRLASCVDSCSSNNA
jgi:transcriptional regulator with XRE-family HTH domain